MRFSFVFLCVAVCRLNEIHARSSVPAAAAAASLIARDAKLDADVTCGISGVTDSSFFAQPQAWPWQALIYCSNGKENITCSGSLVSDKWVITAAHCLFSDKLKFSTNECKVVFGKTKYVNSHESDPTEVASHLESYLIHEQYDHLQPGLGYDIALLKLDKAVEYNNSTKPICLPFGLPELQKTSHCYIIGWSHDEPSKNENAKVLKQQPLLIEDVFSLCANVTDLQICVGPSYYMKEVCEDPGVPLFCKEADEKWYLRGVTSSMTNNCYLAIFTKVTGFQDWINENIANS